MNEGEVSESCEALFVYGTLLAPEIIHAVIGRVPKSQPCTLSGYARFTVRQQVYPGIIERAGGLVDGALYRGIRAEEWQQLDEYEGSLYVRRSVRVVFDDVFEPSPVAAGCYVVPRESASALSTDPWDFGQFMREHRAGFRDTWE